jgi:hypothetical protein
MLSQAKKYIAMFFVGTGVLDCPHKNNVTLHQNGGSKPPPYGAPETSHHTKIFKRFTRYNNERNSNKVKNIYSRP